MRRIATILMLFFAYPACAYFEALGIEPTTPVAGQPFEFTITTGGCDGVIVDHPNASDFFRTVTVSGNVVTVTIRGTHQISTNFCFFPRQELHFSVGTLPPGTYAFHLLFRNLDVGGQPDTEVASTTFTVSATQPIPTFGAVAKMALLLGLLLLAARHFQNDNIGQGNRLHENG